MKLTHTFVYAGTKYRKTPERLRLKGRRCLVLAKAKPAARPMMVYSKGEWKLHRRMTWGTAAVRFENGEGVTLPWRGLRRLADDLPPKPAA